MVRAKFKVIKVERTQYNKSEPTGEKDRFDRDIMRSVPCEMQTIVMSPVYSSEPGSENKKFWDASPSGELRLGTINMAAAEYFVLGGEYYMDFTRADG